MGDATAPSVEDTAAQLDLLRRRVLNVVGHELRTPITTLRGLAEQLDRRDLGDEAAFEVHDAIRRTARRVEGLVDDLLVAAGVSTALPVGEPVPTPVAGAVAEAADRATGSVPTIEGDLDAVVLARPGALRRVLAPLLANASAYGGGAESVRIDMVEGEVVVAVIDRGPGIPAAEVGLVTEPFFRGERAVMTAAGLGLGLAVAAAIAGQHAATVSVGNGEGGGAVAEVRWPAP